MEESLGKILQQKRFELNLEIKFIANKLKVKEKYIEAIESENWQDFAANFYISGLILSYAKILKLDEKIINEKINNLPFKINLNSKHKLVNIGENIDLTPDKDMFFNFLLISILLFFIFLIIFNSLQNKERLIKNSDLIEHFLEEK